MNIVRARRYGLGQDIPDIYDPALQQAIDTGVVMTDAQGNPITILDESATIPAFAAIPPPSPTNVPKPSSTVPTPPGFYAPTPIASSPYQTVPAAAPRVNIPTTSITSSLFSSTLLGLPTIAWLGIGLVLALSAGGGRRRR